MVKCRSLAAALLVVLAAGCGGSDPVSMPDVNSMRLDVALSDLGAVGIDEKDVEIVGGGTFGVLDKSNWTVCEQDPEAGTPEATDIRLIVDRTCPSGAASGDAPTAPVASSQAPPASSPPPAGATTEAAVETFEMPKLVGANLQDAQDQLQALGSYVLDQQDASGMGRLQLVDSNWQVCSQRPKAGSIVSADAIVVLAGVKLDESCP
jgi:hypothetical protein